MTLLVVACQKEDQERRGSSPPAEMAEMKETRIEERAGTTRSAAPPALFRDVTAEVGVDFVHFNGMVGEFYFCEMMGAGVALFDADNDGDLDLYLGQGRMLGDDPLSRARPQPTEAQRPLHARFYRNLLVEKGRLAFEDVTVASGLDSRGYAMGVATGDYDRDGFVDLYVTNYGDNVLYRNDGDGTFSDVTERAGVQDGRWSSSAAFFDHDRDGYLDLMVVNYVAYDVRVNKACYSASSAREYCGPLSFDPIGDRLFHNRGDGTFEDGTLTARLGTATGSGLGIACRDVDRDGDLDVFVANDGMANHLWINDGEGHFAEEGTERGVAYNMLGKPEASMGLNGTDLDGDGHVDFFVTHLADETHTLYVNDGEGYFDDATRRHRLAAASTRFTGFGTAAIDIDNDGWLDLVVVNGHVLTLETLAAAGDPFPLHQKNQIFMSEGGARFREASARGGPAFTDVSEVSRGLAWGDLDNDGDVDLVVANNNGPARVLRNEVGQSSSWIRLVLRDATGPVDCPGARVEVITGEGRTVHREVATDGSYLSAGDPRLTVGLGDSAGVRRVRVRYLDGTTQEWENLALRQTHTLERKPR